MRQTSDFHSLHFLYRGRICCRVPFLIIAFAGLLFEITPASAQDTFIGGNGAWSQTNNWSLGRLPGSGDDCIIPSSSSPTDDAAGTCHNITVATGDTLTVTPGYLDIYGSSIANNGSILIGNGNGLGIDQTATLSGSGAVTLTTSGTRVGGINVSPILVNQQTIQGQGNLGLGTVAITNQGTILANGGTLNVQPNLSGLTNTGLMQAAPGSTMDLIGQGPFNNTGGTITALNNSTILIDSNISGGTIATAGTGHFTLNAPGGGFLIGLTSKGAVNVPSGAVLNLQGTINNTGIFQLSGSILTNGTVTLQGAGSVLMNAGIFGTNGTSSLVNKQLIQGSGTFQQMPLTNRATIQADSTSTPLAIVGSSTTNSSILQAINGATLDIETTVDNNGGIIEAQNGSTVILGGNFNGTVIGGTLTTAGTGVIDSQNGTLDGTVNPPTNAGRLTVKNFNLLNIQGTVNNIGAISLTSNACVALNQPSILTGSGKLTMASTTCIFGSGLAFTNQSTIMGAGTIGDSNPMPITNTGTILANQSRPLTIQPDTSGFTNTGKLMVSPGSTLTVMPPFNNLTSSGILTGGTYTVTGTLGIPGDIVANGSNITLTGSKAEIFNNNTSNNALSTLTTNSGFLSLQTGQALSTTANYSNSGITVVGAASTLAVAGTYTQAAGATTVDGTLSARSGMSVQKGTLVGKGTIASAVTSSATVTAGDSSTKPGVLAINGTFTQNLTGSLNISVGGTAAGKFGELIVSNGVALGGTLSIKLVNGFVPVIGDTFTILSGTAISGTFAIVKGASINSSEHFQVNYNSTSVSLSVVAGH